MTLRPSTQEEVDEATKNVINAIQSALDSGIVESISVDGPITEATDWCPFERTKVVTESTSITISFDTRRVVKMQGADR